MTRILLVQNCTSLLIAFCSWQGAKNAYYVLCPDNVQAEKLLGLFPYIILFGLYQSSSSNSHYKLKSTKVPSDLCLDKTRFLSFTTQEVNYSLQLALMEWELLPNCLLNQNSHQNICWCLFHTVHSIMVDDTQPWAVLEIWGLQNLGQMFFSLITLWACFKHAKN